MPDDTDDDYDLQPDGCYDCNVDADSSLVMDQKLLEYLQKAIPKEMQIRWQQRGEAYARNKKRLKASSPPRGSPPPSAPPSPPGATPYGWELRLQPGAV